VTTGRRPTPGALAIRGGVTCGVTTDGALYCWGAGLRGQLGTGSSTSSLVPVQVPGGGYTDVSVGGSHVCALRSDGTVCWGTYDLGGFQPAVPISSTPTVIAPANTFVTLSSGVRHTCGVAANGTASCWGSNSFGALGDGLQALIRRAPVAVLPPR
jgi:alpha-tubulin suppressor-like RCC1 family protein